MAGNGSDQMRQDAIATDAVAISAIADPSPPTWTLGYLHIKGR